MSLRVTFLGTAGAVPTTERNPSGLLVEREGERLLFDVGEGTQRQMMRFGVGFDVSELFVTHLHGDHVLGLPGLIQTWDFNDRTDPLTVHSPPGTQDRLRRLVGATGTDPSFRLDYRTARPGATVRRTDEYEIRAFRTDHDVNAVGYALVEDDRKGRFDRERAEELGVPVGPAFGRLHEGESIELDDGTTIHPEQVVGAPRSGRRVVYTGDTRPTAETVEHAAEADLLVHDATFADDMADRARKTAHSTAGQAGKIATQAGARRLALTHVSSRYAGDASALLDDAEAAFDGETLLAHDGLEITVPYPDSEE